MVTDFSYDLTRLFVLKNMKKKKSDFPLNMKCQGHRCQTEVKATSVITWL